MEKWLGNFSQRLSPSDIFPLTSSAVRLPKSLPAILYLKNISSVLNLPTLRSAPVAVLRSLWSILFFTVRSFPSNVFLLLRLASLLMALGLGHCIPFHRTPLYGKPSGSLYAQLIAWCGKRCRVLPLNCLNIDSGLYSPPFLYLTALDVHSWP